jgi:hypothetical protein
MFHHNLFQKEYVKVGVTPTSFGAATAVTGANIVRGSAQSMAIVVNHALPTQTAGAGTPTGTITITVADGATTSPVTAVTLSIPATNIAAAGSDVYLVNLEGLNANMKITATADLTAAGGGNTPLCLCSVSVILADFATEPQPSALTVYARA